CLPVPLPGMSFGPLRATSLLYQRPLAVTLGFSGAGCGNSLCAGLWREAVMPTGRPVEITRTELSATELRPAAGGAREADAARRMLALALVLEGKSRKEAAEACGRDRQRLAGL